MHFTELPTIRKCIETIQNKVPMPDILDQLAEEAVELSHAALKLARIKRGTNPTPVSEEDATANVIEEWSDLALIMKYILELEPDGKIIYSKLNRWNDRIEDSNSRSKQGST